MNKRAGGGTKYKRADGKSTLHAMLNAKNKTEKEKVTECPECSAMAQK